MEVNLCACPGLDGHTLLPDVLLVHVESDAGVLDLAVGGVVDIIEDGSSGLLVPGGNSKAMAQAILWLLSDREKAEHIGLAARQRVAEKFTVERYVAEVQSLYDSLIGVDPNDRAPSVAVAERDWAVAIRRPRTIYERVRNMILGKV